MNGPQTRIESIHIKGFRSLANVTVSELPDVTVMIGSNGSGKSNIIRFFELLSWMLKSRKLAEFVARQGGADDQLFGGRQQSPLLQSAITIKTPAGQNDYQFTLAHAHPDRLIFLHEAFRFSGIQFPSEADWQDLGSGHNEAQLVDAAQGLLDPNTQYNPTTASTIVYLLRDCATYQFHDTSDNSPFKIKWDVTENKYLRSHGGNLAAILYRLEHEDRPRFDLICRHIGRILPEFDRFVIDESYGKVLLRWKAKWTDKTFGAHLTSDGSLRFFALVTLLNLPSEMLPSVILLDEPELGLHPAAIGLVAEMIEQLSHEKQIVVATQSPLLVDEFELDEIVVLDLEDGRTKLRKLNADDYHVWLEQDYTPSQLWQKNVLGGRP
jgi:predicted ATPase